MHCTYNLQCLIICSYSYRQAKTLHMVYREPNYNTYGKFRKLSTGYSIVNRVKHHCIDNGMVVTNNKKRNIVYTIHIQ